MQNAPDSATSSNKKGLLQYQHGGLFFFPDSYSGSSGTIVKKCPETPISTTVPPKSINIEPANALMREIGVLGHKTRMRPHFHPPKQPLMPENRFKTHFSRMRDLCIHMYIHRVSFPPFQQEMRKASPHSTR